MIIIKFFCNWATDEEILNTILTSYDWNIDPNYKSKYSFSCKKDYTHAIVLNCTSSPINLPKDNIIGTTQEPPQLINYTSQRFIYYVNNNFKSFLVPNKFNLQLPFKQSFTYMLPHINDLKVREMISNYPEKKHLMNYVYSKKNDNPNLLYYYRHVLGNNILFHKKNIDIYGSATTHLKKMYVSENIKDKFDWEQVSNIYKDYKFSIVIENSRNINYFSEKLIIPLLCGCTPLYLGCTNIETYFPNQIIHLSGNINTDLSIINNVLINPNKYYKKINIKKVAELIHMKNLINNEFI